MDGFQFEYRCAELLRNRGFHKVSVTQSIGDQGIDVIAYKNGEKYGIQCKYYSHTVGNKAVQEAYSGAGFYDCDHAMVMTNSTFSRAAKELAEKLDVQLMEGCPSNDISGAMYKILRLINITMLILEAFILCGSFLFQYPELTLPGYFLLGLAFLAAVSSLPGWHRLFFSLFSGTLYLLVFLLLIIPGIFYGTLNYWLLLSILPVVFSFAHVFFLQKDLDRSDEERPIKRKEKRKISRLGRLYADALSAQLKSPVTFQNGQKTEGGYLFAYDCCCSDIQLIHRAELYLNKSLPNRYDLQLTDTGLSLTQNDRKNFHHH